MLRCRIGEPLAKKDPKRRALTRKRIMDAYIDLLAEDTVSSITASAVIKKAAVNRSTFYVYFSDIEDLYSSIEEELLEDMNAIAQEAIATTDDLDIINLVSKTYTEHGKLIGLLMKSPAHSSFTVRIKKQLQPIIEKGLFEYTNPELAPFVAEFVSGGLLSLYAAWYNTASDVPLEDLAPVARALVFSCMSLQVP